VLALIVREHRWEARLTRFESGDPAAKPPVPPAPGRVAETRRYWWQVRGALAAALVISFDYAAAAAEYEAMAREPRFELRSRIEAAENAAILRANIGGPAAAREARAAAMALARQDDGPLSRMPRIELEAALAELGPWNVRGPDEGATRAARRRALAAMEALYRRWRGDERARVHVIEAAYQVARLRRAAGERGAGEWCRRTMEAFAFHSPESRAGDDRGSPHADRAAECAYRELDARIGAGCGVSALRAFGNALDALDSTYGSRGWSLAAKVRKASLLDCGPRPARGREAVDQQIARLYGDALLWARAFQLRNEAVDHASRRLSFFARLLGDAKMREATRGLADPKTGAPFVYRDGDFLRLGAGAPFAPAGDPGPAPAPDGEVAAP
jgi:hypothetical protein